MRKTGYRVWDIFYPVLYYYMISSVVFFALGMILGDKQELYMLKQLISSGATIPFLVKVWKQECYVGQVVYGKQKMHVGAYVVQLLLSALTVGCLGMAWNNLIAMTSLIQASGGFQTANENFFASTMLMEILASCVVVPIAEELLFRGIVQKRCCALAGVRAGILFSALFFGFIHVNLVQFLYAGVLGLILGVIVQRTGKISLAVAGHAAANLIAIVRAETGIFKFSYKADFAGIGFSLLLVCAGATAGWILLKRFDK